MTSEDERSGGERSGGERSESPEPPSGERSEPRGSEPPEQPSGERSEPRGSESPEPPSEERSEPRGSGADGDDEDDIPLDIAGHEDRDRPDDATALLGVDADEGNDGSPAESGAEADDVADEEVRPVEVLVQLAKDGEIEPWDIDIVRVTDKFLAELDAADLRTSGRALFYASVLLRMKSDVMLDHGEAEEAEAAEPWEAAGEDAPVDPGADPFASLEQEMDRRLERKRARGMPETLDELVRDLREAERDTWWKESREYDTSDSPGGYQRGTQELDYRTGDDLRMADEPTTEDVTGTAHTEDIDAVIDDVYGACLERWEAGRDEVLYAEIAHAGGSRVETFLGLLFLSHRGQVRLQQDDLFGDLWVQDPNAVTGSEEAVAD
ncbi:MAG: segregation/condensation protein A [Halorientalis sp.]